jgi:quinol monooxygenase YgiN
MKDKVTVIAHLRARPGKEKQTREALLALCGPTRAEKGCINYDLHESADDPALFAFHENWVCKDDLDSHLKTAHIQGFFKRIDELLAEPPKITLWTFIG